VADEPKRVVAAGYDRIGEAYMDLVRSGGYGVRERWLGAYLERLPGGATVLDLGCGSGDPMTQRLAERARVTGLDISSGQLGRAVVGAPGASFVQGDMVRLPFCDGAFDGTSAFYSMTHVPRAEHAALLSDVRRVLRPEGWLCVTMGAADVDDWHEADWMGAPNFFSHFGSARNDELVAEAGFSIAISQDETELEYGQPVTFHWVLAQKRG
jgi:ubiquinone/menaquinone biosynthesis C-methylase UbiE